MDLITEQLHVIENLLKKKDYNGTVKIVDEMLSINNDNLNRYLKIIMDLLSLITTLSRSQIDNIKEIDFANIELERPNKIFHDIDLENKKRDLIFHRRFSCLIHEFPGWENNIYQNILKILILLANEKEQKNKENILKLIKDRKYERARVLLENRALRHRTKKLEQVALILLEKIAVLMNSKTLPKINLDETKDYIQAIKNNNFELALKLIENYNFENSINFNKSPIYFLLRDICKTLKNIKNYQNYSLDNNIANIVEQQGDSISNKYEEIKRYGIATIKCKSKYRTAKILNDIIGYPEIEGIVIDNGKTVILKYSPYRDINNKIPEMMKKANKLSAKKETKEALRLYLEILKCENISSIVYAKIGLCFVALNRYDKAIEYLKVAMELGKKEGKIYDFYSLINRLEGNLYRNEIKPTFKPKDNKFNFETTYNFGLGDISEITDSIILTELAVDEACQRLLINKEYTDLIKLVYAKEFFSKGEIKLGDKFMKSVEQSENKTPRTINALEEVKRNKKMYINKKETTLELTLKLKP